MITDRYLTTKMVKTHDSGYYRNATVDDAIAQFEQYIREAPYKLNKGRLRVIGKVRNDD